MRKNNASEIVIASPKSRRIKLSPANKAFYIFNTVFWILILFIVIYPLYLVVICSISDPSAVAKGEVYFWPVGFTTAGYESVMRMAKFWRSYANSLIYTAGHIVVSVIVTLMAAYPLSRPYFPGKKLINLFIIIPMFFSGGLIPTFLVMRNLGFYNNPWMLILHGCVTTWNLMVARTFIQTSIPEDLFEAAQLDGASHFQYFRSIIMPLSKTIIAVLAVYYGVAIWNDYFTGLVYIKDTSLLPLQTVLRQILATLQIDMSEFAEAVNDVSEIAERVKVANLAKYCIIVLSTAPIVILYATAQKFFQKGIMIGSLKG